MVHQVSTGELHTMRKYILSVLLFLASISPAFGGYTERTNCADLNPTVGDAHKITCKQTTTTGGRAAGHLFNWNGSAWVDIDTDVVGGSDDDQTASEVPFIPAGSLSSTNVQDAIEELEAAVGFTGDASDIDFTPAGNIAATDVQAAIQELDTEKASTSHTQAATTVTFSPTGLVSSTNVQTAIAELDTEKSATGHNHDGTYKPVSDDAADLAYTPSVGADWGTDPDDVAEALDQVAERITDLDAAKQPLDSDLTAIAALACADGKIIKRATGVWDCGDETVLDSDLSALAANSTNGLWARTGAGTGEARTIVAGSSKVSILHGAGTAGNPNVDVVPGNILLQDLGGTIADVQVPDLDSLSSGLTASRCVETDGAGFLVSAAALCGSGGSGTPGGADTQIQFNDGGVFGGESDFTWNKTTNTMTVGDCATNCIEDDPSEITGQKTRTRLNANGYEVASDAVLTDGEIPVANSSGVLVDSGLTSTSAKEFHLVFHSKRDEGLEDTDDIPKVYPNLGVTKTITEVKCWTDTGTSTINLQRDDGSAANILASNLVCDTGGETTSSFTSGENIISTGHNIDFVQVTAATSGAPTKVTVAILGTK
jgi:hypothetical protein